VPPTRRPGAAGLFLAVALFWGSVTLVVAVVVVLDAFFLWPQSHGVGKVLDGLLMLAAVALLGFLVRTSLRRARPTDTGSR